MSQSWKQERREVYVGFVYSVLFREASCGRYSALYQICKMADITGPVLAKTLKRKTLQPEVNVETRIFYDMSLLAAQKIEENAAVRSVFNVIYETRYPSYIQLLSRMREIAADSESGSPEMLHEIVDMADSAYKDQNDSYILLAYASARAMEDDGLWKDVSGALGELRYSMQSMSFEDCTDGVCLDNGEQLYGSPLFKRFVKELTNAIASHFGTDARGLQARLRKLVLEDDVYDLVCGMAEQDPGYGILLPYFDLGLCLNRNGFRFKCVFDEKYEPSVKVLTEILCFSRMRSEHLLRAYHDKKFTAKHMERYISGVVSDPDKVRELADALLHLYISGYLINALSALQEKTYTYFNWDSVPGTSGRKVEEEYRASVTAQLRKKDEEIAGLKHSEAEWADKVRKLEAEVYSADRKIEKKYLDEIAAKDLRIRELETQAASMENYMEKVLNTPDNGGDSETEIVMDAVKSHRYLFVGEYKEMFPRLKQEFSGSVFLDSNGMRVRNVKVDAVVILAMCSSHALFYRSESVPESVPRIICRGKTYNSVYACLNAWVQNTKHAGDVPA